MGKDKARWNFIMLWRGGKLAETASRYLSKGKLVFVEGRLKTRSWTDQNGVRHSRTEIIAQNFQLGPRGAGETIAPAGANEGVDAEAPANLDNLPEDIPVISEDEISADDLPF